jgi:hypothetical protein
LNATQIAPEETAALAVEISAIRLQLKRLAAEQQVAVRQSFQRSTDD